jgi:hypothetical protein
MTEKKGSDEKTLLQSQTDKSFNDQIQKISLPKPPPLLQFKWQKDETQRDLIEQNITAKGFLDNHKETTGISIQKAIIQYPLNIYKVIDYCRQINPPLIQLFLDSLKLQKGYINAFQPLWVDHMRVIVANCRAFQDKMILLFIHMCNRYFKNIRNRKIEK